MISIFGWSGLRVAIAVFSTSVCIAGIFVPSIKAQDAKELASAKLAPIDAGFYSASLRLHEQWDRLVAGPVVKEFLELSAVQNGWEQFRSEWIERDGIGSNVRVFFENPNSQDALAFMKELSASEVFIFGDKNVAKWYESQAQLNEEMRAVLLSTEITAEELVSKIMMITMDKAIDLTIPIVLIGARCKNEDLALNKLDQLEALLLLGRSTIPQGDLIFKNLDRIDDSRGNRVQLRLDGTQMPWDDIWTDTTFDEETKDRVREVVDKKSITITIGMLDGFFVFGISPSSKSLLEIGKGKSILDHPDMQPVKEAMSRSLTSVNFTSDALVKATFEANLNNFFSQNVTTNIAPQMRMLDEKSKLRDFFMDLVKDFSWIDESIAKLVPEFKGTTSLSYLTNDGWERHDYLRTKVVVSDASSKLKSLEHLGDSPMMFIAGKLQYRPEYFQLSRKIVQKLKARFDEAFEFDWSAEDSRLDPKAIVESVLDWVASNLEMVFTSFNFTSIIEIESEGSEDFFWPYLVRLADVWEKKFLPAMTGEHAIVLSGGNLAAKQWHKNMPPSVDPLPFPEFAGVCGIKDMAMLKDAFEDVLKLCDELVESIREKAPDAIPAGFKVLRPTRSETRLGEVFWYAIPDDCPVPKEMMPQLLFAGDYMIDSFSDKQSKSLAEAKQLAAGFGSIDPMAIQSNVSYIHIGRIFEFARPWIRYALTEGMESMEDSLLEEVTLENYELTGKDLLSAWGVLSKFGEMSSSTLPLPKGGAHVRSVYKSQKLD